MPAMSKVAQDGLEWYKEVMEENSLYLVENLRLTSHVYASLISRRVFTTQEVQDLEDERIGSDCLWKCVKLLQKKSSRDFKAFLDILRDTGQKHITAKLNADIKHKAKYNESERCAQENINKYIHEMQGKSKHISMTDQNKFTSELVLKSDYQYVTSVNKKLLQEIEELNEELKEEKQDHKVTKGQLNDMIKQCRRQLEEIEKIKQETEHYKEELKKGVNTIKEVQAEKTALREELDRTRETMEQTVPKMVEESDGSLEEMKEMHAREVAELSKEISKMNAVIQQQKNDLQALNSKVFAIMHDNPQVQSDSFSPEEEEGSALECLDRIGECLHAAEPKPPKQKTSKEKRQEIKKQLEEVERDMHRKEEQWNREREQVKERENAMRKSIYKYKQDIQKLKKEVDELKTPSPAQRGRSDSLVSQLNLPQVDVGYMVNQQPQRHSKPIPRQTSRDTIASLPTFHQPRQVPVTYQSYPFGSGTGAYQETLKCHTCRKCINRTELMTGTCTHHVSRFNTLQQRWQCCQQRKQHPGCRASKHTF